MGKLGGGISNVINQARGIAANAFNSIKNALPTLKPGVPQNLETINAAAKAVDPAAATTSGAATGNVVSAVTGAVTAGTVTAGAVAGAVAGATGSSNSLLSSAAEALNTFKTTVTTAVNSVGSAVTNAANTLAKAGTTISTASVDSAVASGVDNLPGGQDAISSRTDYSKQFARAIPGTGSIKTLVDNASTAVNNGISLSNAISTAVTSVSNTVTNIGNAISNFSLSGAASSLTGFLSSGLDKLKSLGLSALVQAGLPAAAAAQLNSAITGLSSGLVKIITPKIGLNTNNRSQLDAQTTALLGTVPTPNLTGTVPDSATAARSAVIERNNRINGIINQIETLTATRDSVNINYRDAKSKYTQAQNSLPQGDSTLIALQGQVNAAYAELSALDKQIADLRKQQLLNVTIT